MDADGRSAEKALKEGEAGGGRSQEGEEAGIERRKERLDDTVRRSSKVCRKFLGRLL